MSRQVGRQIVKNFEAVQAVLNKTIAFKRPDLQHEAGQSAKGLLSLHDATIRELRVRKAVTRRDQARLRRNVAGDVAVREYVRNGHQVSAYTRSKP